MSRPRDSEIVEYVRKFGGASNFVQKIIDSLDIFLVMLLLRMIIWIAL